MPFWTSVAIFWIALVFIFETITMKEAFGFRLLSSKSYRKKYPKLKHTVSLIIPFKNIDIGLEENLKAILNQKFPLKEIIFSVHSKKDPVYNILKKYSGGKVKLIVSSPPEGYSGKIGNLYSAVKLAKGDILLFADSDIRPASDWARRIAGPFAEKSTIATTSYRWYFPTKPSFPNFLKSIWSTVGLEIMSNPRLTYIWGGSFAIRREVFDRLEVLEKWRGETSDDSVITRSMRENGMCIRFVPEAVVATFDNTNFKSFMEFSNRQVFFVRAYMKIAWFWGAAAYSFSTLVFLSAVIFLYRGFSLQNQMEIAAGIALLLPQVTNYIKAFIRYSTLEKILPEYRKFFHKYWSKTLLLEFLVKPITNYNLLRVAIRKKIMWRGKEYFLR